MKLLFFGSTSDSVIILSALYSSKLYDIAAVITQPPKPIGRKQIITPTPVATWATEHQIAVLSFPSNPEKPSFYADEQTVADTLAPFKADLLVSASYGERIPNQTIKQARFGGLNVHPSILPRWRGADPVPLAILAGDHQIGVTVVSLSAEFDEGKIIAQKKIPIKHTDYSDPLRTKLFEIGAELLVNVLPDYLSGKQKGTEQKTSDTPFSKRLTREDGFEKWEAIQKAFTDPDEASRIERKFRALTPWPGVWTLYTINNEEKRLKIISLHLTNGNLALDSVQLEGKNTVSWKQFEQAYPLI